MLCSFLLLKHLSHEFNCYHCCCQPHSSSTRLHIYPNLRVRLEAAENTKRMEERWVILLKKWFFYHNNYLSHECCVLLSTRQQLLHFYPLLSHDRDLQEREGQERDGESHFYWQCLWFAMFVCILVMLVLGLGVNVSVIFVLINRCHTDK